MSSTTSIGGGTVNQTGSRIFLTGTSSGLDTASLIEAAYKQRMIEADKIDIRIQNNNKRAEALTEMQTLGSNMENALSFLRGTYGFSTTSKSAFDLKAGALSSSSSTSPASLVSVSIDNKAAAGSYEFRVMQKATTQKVASAGAADSSVALGQTGSFAIGLGAGATANINVTADMSLADIAFAINEHSGTSGVGASVLKVGDNSYQLILSGKSLSQNISISGVTGDDVLQSIGLTNGAGGFMDEIQAAQQAIIELDGVSITRSSNDFNDLIEGVKINIKNADPGSMMTLEVDHDTTSAKQAMANFVAAYNELRDFVIKHQTVFDGGKVSEDSVLYSDFMLKNMNQQLQAFIGNSYVTGGAISTLADIGLTMDKQNKLVIDEVKLDSALLENFDEVRNLFETRHGSSDDNLRLLANTSTYHGGSLAFDITYDNGEITSVSVNGDTSLFEVTGNAINGKAGTPYEGLRFAFVGTASTTVTYTLNQGIADLMSNASFRYTDVVSGSIQKEVLNVGTQNEQLTTQAERVRERADRHKDSLIEKFSRFEAIYSRAKTTLSQIRAILGIKEK